MLEKVHRYLIFDYNDNPNGATEDVIEYEGKNKYCVDCFRILPKSMF